MRILFVPDEIGSYANCSGRIEPLIKYLANPVVVPEYAWEEGGISFPCVLYSEKEKLFRMWYSTSVRGKFGRHIPLQPRVNNTEIEGRFFVCYAYSQDGLHWIKPMLRKFLVNGHATNIVLSDSGLLLGCCTVVEDVNSPLNCRFKMLVYDSDGNGHDGARTAISHNGIDWEFIGEFPVLPTQDTLSLWYDYCQSQYVAFLKTRINERRSRMISTSKDFKIWSQPSMLLVPDDAVPSSLHFYAQSAFHCYDRSFGLLNRYDQATQRMDFELIVCHPQGNWSRLPSRSQILAPGDTGSWDGGMIIVGSGEPLVQGDFRWLYYAGRSSYHDEDEMGQTSIGIASFINGRLVGQQFDGDGWFQSNPFLCTGGELYIDAKAREPMTVEIWQTGYLGVVENFTKQDCHPFQGDNHSHAVRWQNKTNLDEFRGQYISLRIYGKDSVVYSGYFSTCGVGAP